MIQNHFFVSQFEINILFQFACCVQTIRIIVQVFLFLPLSIVPIVKLIGGTEVENCFD